MECKSAVYKTNKLNKTVHSKISKCKTTRLPLAKTFPNLLYMQKSLSNSIVETLTTQSCNRFVFKIRILLGAA